MILPLAHLALALHAPHLTHRRVPLRAARSTFAQAQAVGNAQVSQTEDLVANAKELLFTPLGPRQANVELTGQSALKNTLSGFTVSLAMIPEAVAFAFVAGVSPIVGLQTAAVMGFFAATFGGRGGIVTGASGACAVVVTALVASHGPALLSACVLLAGLIQISIGLLGGGKFIRLVPHPGAHTPHDSSVYFQSALLLSAILLARPFNLLFSSAIPPAIAAHTSWFGSHDWLTQSCSGLSTAWPSS